MQEKKKTVGRPVSKNKKTKWLKIRVTDEMFSMLKDAPKSDLINKGLSILMPTLGVYIEDENRWVDYKEVGSDANLIAYNSICLAIDIIKLRSEKIEKQHKGSGAFPKDSCFKSSENELFKILCRQKTELKMHDTFYDLRAKDRK